MKKGPVSLEKLVEEMGSGTIQSDIEGMPDYEKFGDEFGNIDWFKYQEECQKHGSSILNPFLEANKDKDVYLFEYSDENGDYNCALEHGNLFKRLEGFCISHH
jgi:hypothetical protein